MLSLDTDEICIVTKLLKARLIRSSEGLQMASAGPELKARIIRSSEVVW